MPYFDICLRFVILIKIIDFIYHLKYINFYFESNLNYYLNNLIMLVFNCFLYEFTGNFANLYLNLQII